MKKYIVKDFIEESIYYIGVELGWNDLKRIAKKFDTKEEAERFIGTQIKGVYIIEEIYITV